jgi:hypothetical protein
MARRLASILPRFVVLPALALLLTATITFAAETQLTPPAAPKQPQTAAPQVPAVLVVPDVRRQAYVFAKGTLEDAGFAWRVAGSVKGYAANVVAGQAPAPGTRVIDTGAPLITLSLAANKAYGQKGVPENISPYRGTPIKVAGRPLPDSPAPAADPEPAAPPQPAAPKASTKPSAKAKRTERDAAAARPPAFTVAGAPEEPLDEIPLDRRATALRRFVEAHPRRTRAAVAHYLYQHAWIVTGAKFGWYRGAEALEILIDLDRRAHQLWQIGAKNERVARRALALVKAKSR